MFYKFYRRVCSPCVFRLSLCLQVKPCVCVFSYREDAWGVRPIKGCISDSRPKHKSSHSSDLSSQSASCPPRKQAVKETLCLCRQPVLRDRTQKQVVLSITDTEWVLWSFSFSKNYHGRSGKPHNANLSVIG